MHKFLVYFLFVIFIFTACNNKKTNETVKQTGTNDYDEYIQNIRKNKKIFQKAMFDKGIKLTVNGPCDDALMDTIHDKSKVYIDTVNIDNEITVTFRFIEACCQEFLVDYKIKKDTMLIDLSLTSEEICSCLCWYRYKYEVKYNDTKVNHIKISDAL